MMRVLQGPSVEQNFWDFLSKKAAYHYDPPQVKCQLLISSIFDAMNFQHFLGMMEIVLQHF